MHAVGSCTLETVFEKIEHSDNLLLEEGEPP